MSIKNCPECGKIFNFVRTNLCPECQEKEEQIFRVIRNYISQHPGVSVIDVSRETGISEDKVLRFLRQGRLSISGEKHIKLECELCGRFVSGGRYCPACQKKLTAGLKKIVEEENRKALEKRRADNSEGSSKGIQMHTANLWQNKRKNK
ncbi:MAG: MerR family transcriptional regulator [Clostridia bacterium]|jgi:flagellar operon protein (TIGR03826 family)|nr:MerR family transcriptional regulator [Clostridia bacterium]